jgi:hypothetical protein
MLLDIKSSVLRKENELFDIFKDSLRLRRTRHFVVLAAGALKLSHSRFRLSQIEFW